MNEEAKNALDLRLAHGEISHEEYSKTLALLAQGSTSTTPAKDSPQVQPQSLSGQTADPKPKQAIGKGCTGCLGIIILLMVIGWIAEIGGCENDNKPPQANAPAAP